MLKRLVKYCINGGMLGAFLAHSDWFMFYWEHMRYAIWLLQHGGEIC